MFNMRRQKKQLAISLERWAFPRWGLVVLLLFGIGTGLSVYGQAGKQNVVATDSVADSLVSRSVCVTLLDLLHHGVADASFHFLRLCRIRKST